MDKLASQLRQCTVRITIANARQQSGIVSYIHKGTGFFIAPQRIVSCAHVLRLEDGRYADESNLLIEWQGEQYKAKPVRILDENYPDLALIQINCLDHPCVYVDPSIKSHAPLRFFGYPASRDIDKFITESQERELGIPPHLYHPLHSGLLECGFFTTDPELNAIFVDERISLWRNHLPESNNQTSRVKRVIQFLYSQFNQQNQNALVLFLSVLSELIDPVDDCYQRLINLIHELKQSKFIVKPSKRDLSVLTGESLAYVEGGEEFSAVYDGQARRGSGSDGITFSFSQTRVLFGTSGAPILNEQTGGVCGIVKHARSSNSESNLGGRAVPITEVWKNFPNLALANSIYHDSNHVWTNFKEHSRYTRFLLPPPFEWSRIPKGFVTLKLNIRGRTKEKRVVVADFQISKYPITNAQFQVFVDDPEGYRNSQWWVESSDMRRWRAKYQSSLEPSFEGDDLPRTNVSWFECLAFCRWLSHKTGEFVNLPREAQWQRAAQGDSTTTYPWGMDWTKGMCNSWTPPDSDGLKAVDSYPNGASFFGVLDMSGNAWEWCLDEFEPVQRDKVLRGGSFKENRLTYFRADFRRGFTPNQRGESAGFRVVKAI